MSAETDTKDAKPAEQPTDEPASAEASSATEAPDAEAKTDETTE